MKIKKLDIFLNDDGDIVLSQVEDPSDIDDIRFVIITNDMLNLAIEGMRSFEKKSIEPEICVQNRRSTNEQK